MMSLRRTVHNLLGFRDPEHWRRSPHRRCRHAPSAFEVPGLRCVAGKLPTSPPLVVESAALGSKPPPSRGLQELRGQQPPAERMDEEAPGLGCLYGRGGGAGLELCTESLGFESCCDGRMGAEERRAEQEIRRLIEDCKRRTAKERGKDDEVAWRRERRWRSRTEAREFPPPLPSLGASGTASGHPSCFLKAEKKEGRLVLTEVWVERPEVLRASRQDGRLRLKLVRGEPEQAENEARAEVEEDAVEVAEVTATAAEAAGKEEVDEMDELKEEEEEEEQRWWQLPVVLERRREGGEHSRGRCHEMVRGGLQPPSFWKPRFVTTA